MDNDTDCLGDEITLNRNKKIEIFTKNDHSLEIFDIY